MARLTNFFGWYGGSPTSLFSKKEHYFKSNGSFVVDGVTQSAGWHRLTQLYQARTQETSPGVFTTTWYKVFNRTVPSATPSGVHLYVDDSHLDNTFAPYTASVDWSYAGGADPDDFMWVEFWQNGSYDHTIAVAAADNFARSNAIYSHGDTFKAVLYYHSDGGNGPSFTTSTNLY
jgi:hypothetical protein